MDSLLTVIAVALLCLAAWLLYKRYTARYKSEPVEEDEPEVQEAVADPEPMDQQAPPTPEPKKEA